MRSHASGARTGGALTHAGSIPAGIAGFTLIEITIAAALFAFLAFVTAELYPIAGINGQAGRNTSFAARFAQACVEDMKSKTFTYVTGSNALCLVTNQQGSNPATNVITASAANIEYTLTISATNCSGVNSQPCNYPTGTLAGQSAAAGNPGLTLITVVVTWTEPSAPGAGGSTLTRTYTITTMRHNYF